MEKVEIEIIARNKEEILKVINEIKNMILNENKSYKGEITEGKYVVGSISYKLWDDL